MNTSDSIQFWILIVAIVGIVITAIGIYLSYRHNRRANQKSDQFFVSASRDLDNIHSFFKDANDKRRAAVAVLNFFTVPKNFPTEAICSHMYFTILNESSHQAENVNFQLLYDRRYLDETDPVFLRPSNPEQEDTKTHFTLIDKYTVQVNYSLNSINPGTARVIMHPMLFRIPNAEKQLSLDDPMYVSINKKDFDYGFIRYSLTSKNIQGAKGAAVTLVNIPNQTYQRFFQREKMFLEAITRHNPSDLNIVEVRNCSRFKQGRTRKKFLVAQIEDLNISYSFFRKIVDPEKGTWNFAQEKPESG